MKNFVVVECVLQHIPVLFVDIAEMFEDIISLSDIMELDDKIVVNMIKILITVYNGQQIRMSKMGIRIDSLKKELHKIKKEHIRTVDNLKKERANKKETEEDVAKALAYVWDKSWKRKDVR